MSNIQVTHSASPDNARSESSVVINPSNPTQIVAASKKFRNIQTYDFTLATSYSADGGLSWNDSADLTLEGPGVTPFTMMTDPTLAWDNAGNVFLVGLTGNNPPTWDTVGIVIYKSTDGGRTWSAPQQIHASTGDDKQWAAGDGHPASPHYGNVYAVWDDLNAGGMAFARTLDHGATWIGPGTDAPGSIVLAGTVFPEIDVSDDGTVYVASMAGSEVAMIASTDGGESFHSIAPAATGISTLENSSLPTAGGFPIFPGGNFRVLTDPTASASGTTVTVAWADFRENVSRIYYAQSTDGGASWWTGPSGRPLLTDDISANMQHFHPRLVTDPNGVIGCALYEFGPKPTTPLIDVIMAQSIDRGASFDHSIVTDRPWDPKVDAPLSHGDPTVTFIGDYFGLDADTRGFHPLWTDTRTGIQELWTDIVPAKSPNGSAGMR
ncbi:sialidase family protein [Nocardia terpenica]|uniref:Exo-alpha-sialidase n=1 Tax=Nocardia terpenica TaxID=455432 RepID=A0A6G9Z2U5_9NOCA|nr:sialidase family protein [Nocardia terpenica]QIS19929.1 hypothetical protein F6W96_18140 [Nocardia terpenica]